LDVHPCRFFGGTNLPPLTYDLEGFPKLVCENIRALREKHEYSQNELTTRASLPRGYVAQIERKRPDLTLGVLEAIANALDVEVRKLMDAKESPHALK
jgi:transcriptional regulator with XRE-family HTH domain